VDKEKVPIGLSITESLVVYLGLWEKNDDDGKIFEKPIG